MDSTVVSAAPAVPALDVAALRGPGSGEPATGGLDGLPVQRVASLVGASATPAAYAGPPVPVRPLPMGPSVQRSTTVAPMPTVDLPVAPLMGERPLGAVFSPEPEPGAPRARPAAAPDVAPVQRSIPSMPPVAQPVPPALPGPTLVPLPTTPEVAVQRVVQEVPVERVTVQRVDTAAAPSTPAAPEPSGGGGGGDPDELVKKIFDPLLRRLKAELLLDRDRRGVLTDLRF
jgi:hypothetical protein